jgi:hypothetical protein
MFTKDTSSVFGQINPLKKYRQRQTHYNMFCTNAKKIFVLSRAKRRINSNVSFLVSSLLFNF